MTRGLVNRWDLVLFLAYEAVALPVALLPTRMWQFAGFIGGMTALGIARRAYRRRHPGSFPASPDDAPFLLHLVVGVPLIAGPLLLLSQLGAGDTLGWFLVAWGVYFTLQEPIDRAWGRRGGPRPALRG
jgi:hypothetical protein